MPAMWWLEVERRRLAREGDLEGSALIAVEQLELAVEEPKEPEEDDPFEVEPDPIEPDERRATALKALQRTFFN